MAKKPLDGYPPALAGRLTGDDFATLVGTLIGWRGWTQKKLADEARLSCRTVYNYKQKVKAFPARPVLVQLVEVCGLRLDIVDHWLLPSIVLQRELETTAVDVGAGPLSSVEVLIQQLRLLLTEGAAGLLPAEPVEPVEPRPTAAEREEAQMLWSHLAACPEEDRPYLVETCDSFHRVALAELLCHESEEAASDRADQAAALAQLALQVARLAPGDPATQSRGEGYALFFCANTTRVGGELPPARSGFEDGLRSWKEGEGSLQNLAEWRVLDLETSLLRDERDFERALQKGEQALAMAPEAAGRILLKKASVYEQMGDGEAALAALRQAETYVDRQREPRLHLIQRFNLATTLVSLNHHEDAEELLPEIRSLAARLELASYSLRVRWLTGRIDAGRGRLMSALVHLEEVRAVFADLTSPWDWALVTLDLAVVRLRRGDKEEVRDLALKLVEVFEAQGIHREAMVALHLFCEAAEHEAATVEFAERLAAYLRKAQRDPGLAFEG